MAYVTSFERFAREESILEGKLEGKLEGRLEGKLETQQEIAKNLLTLGMPLKTIQKMTGLPLNELKEMQETATL